MRFLLGQLFEARVDPGFHRPLTQNLGAEAVDGPDRGFFQMLQSLFEITATVALRPVVADRRAPGAAAASSRRRLWWVNVTAAICSMVVRPVANTSTRRFTNSVVLPVPADASTMRLSSKEVLIRSRASASEMNGAAPPLLIEGSPPETLAHAATSRLVVVPQHRRSRNPGPGCGREVFRPSLQTPLSVPEIPFVVLASRACSAIGICTRAA